MRFPLFSSMYILLNILFIKYCMYNHIYKKYIICTKKYTKIYNMYIKIYKKYYKYTKIYTKRLTEYTKIIYKIYNF